MSDDARREETDPAPEAPGVWTRAVLLASIGFMVFTFASMAALHLYFSTLVERGNAPGSVFNAPRLQATPLDDRLAIESAQQRRLETGRMSIERAMSLIARRGIEAYGPVGAQESSAQEKAK